VWDVVSLESDLPTGTAELPVPQGPRGLSLQVRNLSWRHGSEEAPWVLRDIELDLPAGHVVGLYGPVGSGKSTLIALLSRLATAPRGTILVDGVDLCDVEEAALRAAIAVVPQEAFLFSRSLRDNVGFADRAEAIDDTRVGAAITDAQLADEVTRMPEGLATVVGERGLMLSGGQRQRAQLARAFYRGGRLVLLDDVLSAVDHDTEERLLAVLRDHIIRRGSSAVIVSHRLSALARCDEILVLGDPSGPDRGRIVERGTHTRLLAGGGTYAAAWAAQQQPADG
jgi:ATP-binding cassette subfamily B protein